MRLLIYWIISAISLVVSASIAAGLGMDVKVHTDEPLKVLLGTAALGLINATAGTVLRFLTAPLACLTFGLVWVVINALLFWLVGTWELGYYVGNFWGALVGSLLMGLVLGLLRRIVGPHAPK
jgi:putative membrane protein